MGRSQAVRHWFLVPGCAGSNPAAPAIRIMKEPLISFQNCSFGFTKKKVLNSVDIVIHSGDKIALVGKNGVGKTTFINILSGNRIPDDGETWISPNLSIGHIQQNINNNSNQIVEDYLKKITDVIDIKNKKQNIKNLCKEIKLDLDMPVNQLSGGLKRKLHLVENIIKSPELLLLDEPTNHLDIDSIIWLENYLNKKFKGAFLVISHDRKFLENVTNKVFWMDRGKIKVSPKGFYNFEQWSNNLINHEKREIKNKDNLLKRELDWLSKGVKARRKRNNRRLENISNLKKELKHQKSEFIKSVSKVKIEYSDDNQISYNLIAQIHNISKFYILNNKKKIIFSKFSYKLHKGEKIGVLGKNGAGKTTLFKLFTKQIEPDEGIIKLRKSIGISYFDQHGDLFTDHKSIKENMIPSGGDYIDVNGKRIHICGYLKNFLFNPSDLANKVSTLSGGQRNRLLLAKILAKPNQLMILDEPTNDLDTETLDILIDFINAYEGTVLISSHDRDFLDKTVHKLFYFHGDGKIDISNKKCSDFLDEKIFSKNKNVVEKINTKIENNTTISQFNNSGYIIRKDIKKILQKIEKGEEEISKMQLIISEPDLYNKDKKKFDDLAKEIELKKFELKKLEEQWINLEEENLNPKSC